MVYISIYSETVSIKTNKSESSKNSEFLNALYGIGKLMKKQLPKVWQITLLIDRFHVKFLF